MLHRFFTPARSGPDARRRRRLPILEMLENRLTPASTLTVAGGSAVFVAENGVAHNLTLSVSGGTYTFTDTGDTISLNGGTAANTVTTTGITTGGTITLDMGNMSDVVNIRSINNATTVNGGSSPETYNVSSNAATNTGNLAGINASLTFNAGSRANKLVVSNFLATTGDSNVVVGASTITGFAPSTITYTGTYSLVRLIGSNSPSLAEMFTVNDPSAGTFQLDSNAGGDTAIVEGTNSGTANNINMGAGAATVTVSSDGTSAGSLDNIKGTLNINEGTGAGKTLNLFDTGSATPKNATVTATSVTGFAPATINYKAVGGTFGNITLDGGSGGNTISMTGALNTNYTINTGSGNDNISVRGTGAAASLTVNGQGGSDQLLVNFAAGNPSPAGGINYHGGGQAGDTLLLTGINANTVTNTFLPDSSGTPHLGTVNVDGSLVNYDGVVPVSIGGTMTNLVINLPTGDGDNQAILEDNGNAADNTSQIRSGNGTFETTQFTSPTTSLTVNTGDDGETVTFAALDPAFNPTGGTTINGGTGADTLNMDFSSGVDVIPAGGITLNGGADNGDGIDISAGYTATSVTYNYTDTHSGSIVVDGRTITYGGLSQTSGIFDPLVAAMRTFNFASTISNNITLGDDAVPNNGISEISSAASSPTTDFANPTNLVTVDLGNAGDTIAAGPLDAITAPPAVNLNGGTGSDTFDVTPSTASTFNVDGNLPDPPALPGDTLNAVTPAGSIPILGSTATPTGFTGSYSFLAGGFQPINFMRVETLNPSAVSLTISKVDNAGTGPEVAGTAVTYTIVASNTGSLGVAGVSITDILPTSMPPSTAPGFTSDSYTSSTTGGASGNTASGMGDINDTVTMPAGSTITYIVTANINPSSQGTLSNTATITPPTGVSGSSSSSTASNLLTAVADVQITNTAPSTVPAGTDLTYTITVTNNGPSTALNVVLTDRLPAYTTFVSFSAPAGWTPSTPAVGTTGVVTASDPSLLAGTYQFTLVVHVSGSLSYGMVLSNKALVNSTTTDPNRGNNSATATSTIITAVIGTLQVTQNIPKHGTATLTGSVNNPTPADALVLTVNWGDGTILTYTLPPGTTSFSESHVYTKVGNYVIIAGLHDNMTGSTSPSQTVTTSVLNVPPTVFMVSAPTTGKVGQSLTFVGGFSDPDPASTLLVSWTITQPSYARTVYSVPYHPATDAGALSITYMFTTPGLYTVSYSVKDQYGAVGNITFDVFISA
jgi:uncharacterized repeat protein (TIGR01451 family)